MIHCPCRDWVMTRWHRFKGLWANREGAVLMMQGFLGLCGLVQRALQDGTLMVSRDVAGVVCQGGQPVTVSTSVAEA